MHRTEPHPYLEFYIPSKFVKTFFYLDGTKNYNNKIQFFSHITLFWARVSAKSQPL